MNKNVKIAPSILSADFANLGDAVKKAVNAGADYIHVDVMDGQFVPNISIGQPVVAAIKKICSVPLDVHLMIEQPERHVKSFADSGADIITIHAEACNHLHRTVDEIHRLGKKAGISLNPASPLHLLEEILPFVDLALVMTVNPGWGGQSFIEEMIDKIIRLRKILNKRGFKAELEVDGGINAEIAPRVVKAGATVLVAGAAVFNSKDGVDKALQKIRESIKSDKLPKCKDHYKYSGAF